MEELNLNRSARTVRPLGIKIIGTLTIVFGMLEVQAAFRHEFAGIVTADKSVFTYAAAIVGLFYIASGILVL